MRLVGTAKVDEETEIGCPRLEYAKLNLTSEDGRFAISNMNEGAAATNKPKGSQITYNSSTSEYVFEIPGPDGKPGPVDVQIDVPIYPEEVIAN